MFFPAKNNKSGKAALSSHVRHARLVAPQTGPCAEPPKDGLKMTGLIDFRTDHTRRNGIVVDLVNDNKTACRVVVLILIAHQGLVHF